jgi:hypothetical protein
MPRIALALALAAVVSGCSHISVSSYRAENAAPARVKTVALMPLIIQGATETQVGLSYSPGWITETRFETALSPGEYKPAEAAFVDSARHIFAGRSIITPAEVDAAMSGQTAATVKDAVAAVATRTHADAVALFRVNRFDTHAAGLDNAKATGHADLTLYLPSGEPAWSVSAEAERSGAGFHGGGAPTLRDYVEYVSEAFESEASAMMR